MTEYEEEIDRLLDDRPEEKMKPLEENLKKVFHQS